MRTIYISIIILFCAGLSLQAQSSSSWNIRPFSDFSEPVYYDFDRVFFVPSGNNRFSIEPMFQVFNPFGSDDFNGGGWLDLPGMGDPQKVPIGNGLGILLFISLFYAARVFVKQRRNKK